MPVETCSLNAPWSRWGMPVAYSTFSSPRCTSPTASESTLPCCNVIARAMSVLRSSRSSRMRKNTSARLESDVARQPGSASFAASTAFETSCGVAKSTSCVCSPVAGLYTGPVRPDSPGTILPPIQNPIRSMVSSLRSGKRVPMLARLNAAQEGGWPGVRLHAPERRVHMSELSAQEIVDLSLRHTLYDWQQQGTTRPIPVASARGSEFFTVDGKRYLDFNSQLMGVNIGHADPRVAQAIAEQAKVLPYISPFMTTGARAKLGKKLADLLPGDLDKVFFTLGGAEANENAIRIAKSVTGRQKILARYRSYHGATYATITLTGDPRRWSNEPGMPGVVHVLDPYHGTGRPADKADAALAYLEETIMLEGPSTIAAFILEPVTGTNGILIPPEGYLQGVRELCDRHGILLIADEVMSGFGRTGEWFAVNHWKVVPDIMTVAKGLTSSYVPLGAVAMRPQVAEHFEDATYFGGLTYNSHPLACAAALATIAVYEEDGLIENARRMGTIMRVMLEDLQRRHPSVGATRNIGLFGIVEVVRNPETREPMAPFNGTSPEMQALGKFFRQEGLYTFVRWNTFFTNPPLCITEAELREAFAIIDRGLKITDRAVS